MEPTAKTASPCSSKKRHLDEIGDDETPPAPKRNRSAINILKSRLSWWRYSTMNDDKPSQSTSLKLIMQASRATRAEIDTIEDFTIIEYCKRSFPYELIDGGKPNTCLPLNRDKPVVFYLAIKNIGNKTWKVSGVARNVLPEDEEFVVVTTNGPSE
jgi:hypothetical protein